MVADRALRIASAVFGVAALVYLGPVAFSAMGQIGTAVFIAVCLIGFALSQLLVPLLALTNFRRRTGDPGSFVLDAALFAFVFALFGGYAAALLHVVTSLTLRNLRAKVPFAERILRAAPGVPFWFLFDYVRASMHFAYLEYSPNGYLTFISLLIAAHAAYVFVWFDGFFTLRSGQPITLLWKTQLKDWITWLLVIAQVSWGYGAIQIYLDGKAALAVVAFLPLPLFAYLLRREHRTGIEMHRMALARSAMEAVLAKDDPRPFLRDLLESAQSPLFSETLAIYTRAAGVTSEPVVHAGPLDLSPLAETEIHLHLRRWLSAPAPDVEVGPDNSWALYPINVKQAYYGALLIYRHKYLNDPIQRAELRTLLHDVAPAIANLSEIVATQDAANVDALTGLLNRAGLEARLRRLFAAPYELQATALMLDVDHFKDVNDSLGHAGGDAVLREIAAVIAENCRTHDVIGRYGGEEFLILLHSVDVKEALLIAERIRCAISDRLHVTVSIGLTEYTEAEDAQSVVARADGALYSAKRAGRNRCIAV